MYRCGGHRIEHTSIRDCLYRNKTFQYANQTFVCLAIPFPSCHIIHVLWVNNSASASSVTVAISGTWHDAPAKSGCLSNVGSSSLSCVGRSSEWDGERRPSSDNQTPYILQYARQGIYPKQPTPIKGYSWAAVYVAPVQSDLRSCRADPIGNKNANRKSNVTYAVFHT